MMPSSMTKHCVGCWGWLTLVKETKGRVHIVKYRCFTFNACKLLQLIPKSLLRQLLYCDCSIDCMTRDHVIHMTVMVEPIGHIFTALDYVWPFRIFSNLESWNGKQCIVREIVLRRRQPNNIYSYLLVPQQAAYLLSKTSPAILLLLC